MAASNHYYMTRTLQRYQPQELWVLVECLASITVYSRISKEKKSKYVKMHFTIQISCLFHSWLHCVMLLLLLWEWALVSFITQLISKSCCQKAQTKQHLDATGETLNQSEQWSLWHIRVKVNLTTLFVETTCKATVFYTTKDECCCFGRLFWKCLKGASSVSHHKMSIPYRISCCDWNHIFLRGGNHFKRGARPIC